MTLPQSCSVRERRHTTGLHGICTGQPGKYGHKGEGRDRILTHRYGESGRSAPDLYRTVTRSGGVPGDPAEAVRRALHPYRRGRSLRGSSDPDNDRVTGRAKCPPASSLV
ncbi:hypothetical protein GCM10010295_58290 [Streptomyces intermedius]